MKGRIQLQVDKCTEHELPCEHRRKHPYRNFTPREDEDHKGQKIRHEHQVQKDPFKLFDVQLADLQEIILSGISSVIEGKIAFRLRYVVRMERLEDQARE